MTDVIRLVPDAIYERFQDEMSKAKNFKTFKCKIFGEKGDRIAVYCRLVDCEVNFFCKTKGAEQLIMPYSMYSEGNAGPSEAEIRRRQLENHTGKHRSKVHGVKVPTAAGQPVRG